MTIELSEEEFEELVEKRKKDDERRINEWENTKKHHEKIHKLRKEYEASVEYEKQNGRGFMEFCRLQGIIIEDGEELTTDG